MLNSLKQIHTTIMGVIAGLLIILPEIAAALDGNPETGLSITAVLAGLAIMGIGTAAKDGDS